MTQDRLPSSARPGPFERLESALEGLWVKLDPDGHGGRPFRVAITGCASGEGTTTVALAAARNLARQSRAEVLLLEVDGVHPGLGELCGSAGDPGLEALLSGTASLEEARRPTEVPGLSVVPWGPAQGGWNRGTTLSPAQFDAAEGLLEACSARGVHVVLDVAPVLEHPSLLRILRSAQATVAVLRSGRTTKQDAARLARGLAAAGIPLAGTILNQHVEELPHWLRSRLGPTRGF